MIHLTVARLRSILFAWLVIALGLSACQPSAAATRLPANQPAATAAAIQASQTPLSQASVTPQPSATATSLPRTVWLPEYLPQQLRDTVRETAWLPSGWSAAGDETGAGLRLEVSAGPAQNSGVVPWIYALVAPFPTVADEVTLKQLQDFWKGTASLELTASIEPTASKETPASKETTVPKETPLATGTPQAQAPAFQRLLVDANTSALFTKMWGKPGKTVQVSAPEKIIATAWAEKTTWAIVPFEQLEPRWKVIAVNGQSPVRKDFNPDKYPLAVRFALAGDPAALEAFSAQAQMPESNRRVDQLTTVVVTGVTALVRGTASYMETRGITYPARDIGGWLREADILHVSNEVAFAKNCPLPHDWVGLAFCSREKYIELLRDVGTDVVELTGDHFNDWGPEAILYSLDLYKQEGWKYYGGGANAQEARQPALFEHNGNKIAFVGCNAKDEGYSSASDTKPGAVHCDMDQLEAEVRKLRADGYLPIVTFQHIEYYQYIALPPLQKDFGQMAAAGAVIVSGSQAHQPHALAFNNNALLHYGLGNLFFDQTNQGDAPRTAFIDRHVFYEGRHISTELLTIYLVDLARSRPMTLEERQMLLQAVFNASEW